ncbi:LOW QUALITY PROTEIN: snake venom 5'-nucleotidase-like [Uloborus diversus]|uniref:LOW QUALITY PROTEIN: snake venom 5'-nucleotidase-like n=1 Tax=Uloborus diversus TaxID=327109 RepID=UPI00240A3A45|nr:LOW QUALITY PROTEIN: snake venom 5'-nucleotidase-like [Uloborus diversus]
MFPPLRLAFFVTVALLVDFKSSSCFNLTVLHTNDVHSHFIEFNAFGGRCTESLAKEKKCYGGFARQVTKMKEIRASEENVIFLNGGDFYQGTVWYTLHKWQVVADLVYKLQIDVMSLGNHEFDDGLDGLFPLLKRLNETQVVVCNINSTLVPEFAEYVKPSVVLDVGGEKIGVIGYLTTETKFLSSTGALEFEDEVECIQREARRLVEEEGLNKIIAVGHAGFTVDQDIARRVPEVDIVVGGHTNTFLYSGEPPSNEETQGPYPLVVERENGSVALVVQDFAFGKFLGHLQVQFDDEGRIVRWGGNPILMDSSVPEDAETLEILRPYGQEVQRRVLQTVGRTHVLLLGDRRICRMRECNLGNVMADAALDHFIQQPSQEGWNFVAIALWNSGSIRGSIDERINQGNITIEDILTAAPFGNTMCVVGLKGKHLRQVLEHSVKDYDLGAVDPPGSFLQVSGLRLKYNMSQPVGSRLIEALARCADCRIPKYLPLEDETVYEMVVNTYLAKGGDGFDMVQENAVTYRNVDELDIDILINYFQKHSPIITGLEDRIEVLPTESKALRCYYTRNNRAISTNHRTFWPN